MATKNISYFPPFAVLKKFLQFKSVQGEVQVTLSYDDFVHLVQLMARSVLVDEKWYLERNPDVLIGVRNGDIRSAKHHWVEFGYLEGRLPYELTVDSEWYLLNYQDVAKAVQEGGAESALAHYRSAGYQEGRMPSLD